MTAAAALTTTQTEALRHLAGSAMAREAIERHEAQRAATRRDVLAARKRDDDVASAELQRAGSAARTARQRAEEARQALHQAAAELRAAERLETEAGARRDAIATRATLALRDLGGSAIDDAHRALLGAASRTRAALQFRLVRDRWGRESGAEPADAAAAVRLARLQVLAEEIEGLRQVDVAPSEIERRCTQALAEAESPMAGG